jgi:hypothetical protein
VGEKMDSIAAKIFLYNWQRKVVALLIAFAIWMFVNHSINEIKTISNVPIRIINLPSDKTVQGLLPNGLLNRRITLTLTGSKDVIDELESGDLEVLLDISMADNDDWVVHISKKNLVSLNPAIDLLQHITQVESTDFVVKLSKLVSNKFTISIQEPLGTPPAGYELLDVWPQQLTQTVSGPEEELERFKEKKLSVTFNLADISQAELDAIKSFGHNDEISFPVPKNWREVTIPFLNYVIEDFNDPEAQTLRIEFLRKNFLPLANEIPIRIFYPLATLDSINPSTITVSYSEGIQKKEGVLILKKPLFTKDVSRLFIDVVRNSLEIVIIVEPESSRQVLGWYLDFINPRELENSYISLYIANAATNKNSSEPIPKKREELLRKRFREYMHRTILHLTSGKKLHIKSSLESNQIKISSY